MALYSGSDVKMQKFAYEDRTAIMLTVMDQLLHKQVDNSVMEAIIAGVKEAINTREDFRNYVKTAIDEAIKTLPLEVIAETVRQSIREMMPVNKPDAEIMNGDPIARIDSA